MKSLSLALLICVAAASFADARTWTDPSGKFKIEGDLVSFADNVAQLKLKDGRVIAVHISRLCTADRAFLKKPASLASTDWPRFHGATGAGNVFAE